MKQQFRTHILPAIIIFSVIAIFMYAFLSDTSNQNKVKKKFTKIVKRKDKEKKKEKKLVEKPKEVKKTKKVKKIVEKPKEIKKVVKKTKKIVAKTKLLPKKKNKGKKINKKTRVQAKKELIKKTKISTRLKFKQAKLMINNKKYIINISSETKTPKEILKSIVKKRFPKSFATGNKKAGIPVYFKSYNVIKTSFKKGNIVIFRCFNAGSNLEYYNNGSWLETTTKCKYAKNIAPYLLNERVFEKLRDEFKIQGFSNGYTKLISLNTNLEIKIQKKKLELKKEEAKGEFAIIIDFNNKIKLVSLQNAL